ncbi:hypothetical protein EV426DRAFT_703644 [Tirmania nivea]|nr:hypothetical protein EV426DRAFT_703644 [Tirmania nivea]
MPPPHPTLIYNLVLVIIHTLSPRIGIFPLGRLFMSNPAGRAAVPPSKKMSVFVPGRLQTSIMTHGDVDRSSVGRQQPNVQPLPRKEEVKLWDYHQVVALLRHHQPLVMNDQALEIFESNMYSGKAFLQCDKDEFIAAGLPRGIAMALDDLVREIQRKRNHHDDAEFHGIEVFKTLQTVSCSVDEYCDPSHRQKLRFPFLGRSQAAGFNLMKWKDSSFMEEKKFRELYAAL